MRDRSGTRSVVGDKAWQQVQLVTINGKTLRRSFRQAGDNVFVPLASAWSRANRVMPDRPYDEANDIKAMPALLDSSTA